MSRRTRTILTVVVGLLAGVLAAMLWPSLPRRFAEVTPNALYRSNQPDETELRNIFRKYGIRTILNLRREDYPEFAAEERLAKEQGAEFVRLHVSSTKPFPPETLAELRRVFSQSKRPILVHCEFGVARTGVVVALWRIEQDRWTGDRAVDEMLERGYPERDKSEPMRDYLRNWKPEAVPTTAPAAASPATLPASTE